jgi:hypothetical protein
MMLSLRDAMRPFGAALYIDRVALASRLVPCNGGQEIGKMTCAARLSLTPISFGLHRPSTLFCGVAQRVPL